jgi:DNA processing protein
MSELPDAAFAAALAGLDQMSLQRLSALLRHHSPPEAWQVALGEAPARGPLAGVLADQNLRASWRRSAREREPAAIWQQCRSLGIDVVAMDDESYPSMLAADLTPPPVIFSRGDRGLLDGRRVAVVGTRNATSAGREAARRISRGVAAAGVHVVSGLARGIDGVAHSAVISAESGGRPIGVVGTGLDVVYPREHRDLWEAVANCGLLLSEVPPGTGPRPYRFPQRNRIIAALAEVVVVVESRERGGSLITAAAALDRGIPVMAVPGPATSRAATGTNALLREGAAPAVDALDVLTCLELELPASAGRVEEQRRRPERRDLGVYDCLRDSPRTIDGVALCGGLSLVDAAMSLARLERDGWVTSVDGWFECLGSPLR